MSHALILALSFGLTATSIIVVVLSLFVGIKRYFTHKFDDVFWFAAALFIGWSATFHFRTAYIAGNYDWINRTYLVENGVPDVSVAVGLLAVIISGLLHIRALTWRADFAIWRWMTLLVFAITMMAMWVLEWSH